MKRLFLWLLMVVLFTGAIVGGSLAFLYYHITEEDLPEKAITLAGQTLDEPVGYQWTVPILGGMVWRELDLSPGSAIQTLDRKRHHPAAAKQRGRNPVRGRSRPVDGLHLPAGWRVPAHHPCRL